jgi:Super-infection exclusion protein B
MAVEGVWQWLTTFLQTRAHKALALAVGCGVLYWIHKSGVFVFEPAVLQTVVVVGVLSAAMTVTSAIRAAYTAYPLHMKIGRWFTRRRFARQLRDYIPHMTDNEKRIIAHLIEHNQKTFTVDIDGGHATTLMSRGIVVRMLQPGQVFAQNDLPVGIPEWAWKVLVAARENFPYKKRTDREPLPWRKHWLE